MKKVELLAPAGNYEAFLGAIHAGADAVYLGGEKYGARAYADNFTQEEIISAIRYAHIFQRKVYLTINTMMKEEEYNDLCNYVAPFYQAGLDGVIIQDLGAFQLLKNSFPRLELHASTQMTLTSTLGVSHLKEMGAVRVVPARELSLEEIKDIKDKIDIEIECFVHGAMCYCYSGQCLFSSILGGRSGNRGRCAQPCRLPYKISKKGEESYPFSLKDMCTISFVPKLIEAGIDSFKIEGRMKKPEYAAGVTAIYRKYIDLYYKNGNSGYKVDQEDMDNLTKLYIRSEIQDGYYFRNNGKEMITPGKPSYLGSDEVYLKQIRQTYIEKSIKLPISLYGKFIAGQKAEIIAIYQDVVASVEGDIVDVAQNRPMTKEDVEKQLVKLGNTVFLCDSLAIEVGTEIFIPNKILNELRRKVLRLLEDKIIEKNGFCFIRDDIQQGSRQEKTVIRYNDKQKKDYVVSVSTREQLYALDTKEYAVQRLYLDYTLFLDLSEDKIEELNKKYILGIVYPRIVRKKAFNTLEELYEKGKYIKYAVVKNIETIRFLKDKGFTGDIICDYTIYMCNSGCANYIAEIAQGVCYPVELNKGELMQIKVPETLYKEQLLYSYLPLMVTANCLKKTTDRCGQSDKLESIYDRYQKNFKIKSNCRLCYSELFNCIPMSLHKYIKEMRYPIDGYRIDFTIEDSRMTEQVLNLYLGYAEDDQFGEYTTGHFKRGVE